ncbi:MAG TPA: NAD(P)/FAD-dependent oxidoreductase [Ktedonobacterales bacterium]|nr:NAD(P)/FAD-dependent oxidoreductase [Ktedonobacterales bacterium]
MARSTVVIVGAGPAGLAAGACLQQRGINATIFEAGDAPGTTWRSLYDRLHLHTIKSLSGLPLWPMPRHYPRYPSRQQFADYLTRYADHFHLDIMTRCKVERATHDEKGWLLTTHQGEQRADVIVSATGIFAHPMPPEYPDAAVYQGRSLLASDYHNAAPFSGQHVLVVGAGNTGAEIAIDLAEAGVAVTSSIRAGTNIVPRDLLGVPIQVWGQIMARVPRRLTDMLTPVLLRRSVQRQARAGVPRPALGVLDSPGIPIIGLDYPRLAQRGSIVIAGPIERFTPTGVRFANGSDASFDAVIFATGYRLATDYIDLPLPLDQRGHLEAEAVKRAEASGLYFIGTNYDIRGTLFNIRHEAPQLAAAIATRP